MTCTGGGLFLRPLSDSRLREMSERQIRELLMVDARRFLRHELGRVLEPEGQPVVYLGSVLAVRGFSSAFRRQLRFDDLADPLLQHILLQLFAPGFLDQYVCR